MSEFEADTIQKCPHDAENPYAIISRALIRDKTISPECRWLLIYLLSNADGWIIKSKEIRNHVQGFMGREKVLDVLNEAIEAGYMKREEYLKNNLTRYRYYVSEAPKFKKCFRQSENQAPENRDPEKPTPLKKEHPKEYQKEDIPKREREDTPPLSEKFEMGAVKMQKKEHNELVDQYGEAVIDDYVERLDLFSKTNAKRFKEYSCHRSVIRTWLKRDNVRRIVKPVNEQPTDWEAYRKAHPSPFVEPPKPIDPIEEAKKSLKFKNFSLANRVCMKNFKWQARGELILTHDDLEFPKIGVKLYFIDEEFEEKLWKTMDDQKMSYEGIREKIAK